MIRKLPKILAIQMKQFDYDLERWVFIYMCTVYSIIHKDPADGLNSHLLTEIFPHLVLSQGFFARLLQQSISNFLLPFLQLMENV